MPQLSKRTQAKDTTMRVENLMMRPVRTVGPHDRLDAAARIMWEQDCGCVPVVRTADGDGARSVVGMLTDRDVCIATYTQGRPLADIEVESAMAHSVCSCRTTDNVKVALKVMQANQIHRLPVVDGDEHLVGLLSLADIAREAAREQEQPRKAVTAVDVGETVEMIAQPRSGGGQVVPAAPAA